MEVIEGLKYTREHEWVKAENGVATVGITDYAQHSLGEAVYVELPQAGASIKKGDVLGVVESVKAASDVYSPVSGKVLEANKLLEDEPGALNQNPYENYMAILQMDNAAELNDMMDAVQYKEYCENEDK
ncbi:MAG: glycine cleavage system protein GcvH [Christensenellales bacterium]